MTTVIPCVTWGGPPCPHLDQARFDQQPANLGFRGKKEKKNKKINRNSMKY